MKPPPLSSLKPAPQPPLGSISIKSDYWARASSSPLRKRKLHSREKQSSALPSTPFRPFPYQYTYKDTLAVSFLLLYERANDRCVTHRGVWMPSAAAAGQ